VRRERVTMAWREEMPQAAGTSQLDEDWPLVLKDV